MKSSGSVPVCVQPACERGLLSGLVSVTQQAVHWVCRKVEGDKEIWPLLEQLRNVRLNRIGLALRSGTVTSLLID
jgi:hypothetical protein